MTSQILRAVLFLSIIAVLASCPEARGDLANCIVLRGTSSKLDGDLNDVAADAIYDAYMRSGDSDRDMVFVIDIAGKGSLGSYTIQKISLKLGTWTLHGYKLTAPDVVGIRNGVAEIKMAFRGRIFNLEPGKRNGAVARPRFHE